MCEGKRDTDEILRNLPGDNGDLTGKTELLQGRGEGLEDARLQRHGGDLDVLDGRDDRLSLVDLNVVIDTHALLVVDNVDRVLLRRLILADGGAGEGAEGRDAGHRARGQGGAVGNPEGVAEKRHDGGVRACGLCVWKRLLWCK